MEVAPLYTLLVNTVYTVYTLILLYCSNCVNRSMYAYISIVREA